MVRHAIDGVALLLTGRRDFFWAGGSANMRGAWEIEQREAAAARAAELAARASRKGD